MNEIQLPAIPQMNLYVVDQRNKIQTRTHIWDDSVYIIGKCLKQAALSYLVGVQSHKDKVFINAR